MSEKRLPLDFPPGLYHNGTKGQAKGRWYDGNGVRFYQGAIGPIGGWSQHVIDVGAIAGRPHSVIDCGTTQMLIVGTNQGIFGAHHGGDFSTLPIHDAISNLTPSLATETSQDWRITTFGSEVLALLSGSLAGGLYSTPIATPTPFTSAMGAGPHPNGSYNLIVTPERFVVLLGGSDTMETPGNPFSTRRVYWATQETTDDWVSSDTNTAGFEDLDTDGDLLCASHAPGRTLLHSTTDLWSMAYIGGDLLFSFERVGMNCGVISKQCVAALDSQSFWMGRGKFFMYDGYVRTLPCEVAEKVFGDMSVTNAGLTFVVANPLFNEVTWFYPNAGASDCNRYVTYNYLEQHWSYGQLSRTASTPRLVGITPGAPLMLDATGGIYEHEVGNVRTGMSPFLESGPVMAGEGDNVLLVQKVYPDDKTQGDVSATIFAALEPDLAEASQTVSLSSPTDVRLTGRQFRLRLQEAVATAWRVGVVRVGAIAGGIR